MQQLANCTNFVSVWVFLGSLSFLASTTSFSVFGTTNRILPRTSVEDFVVASCCSLCMSNASLISIYKFYFLFPGSAELVSSRAAGVRFLIQATDDVHTDSPKSTPATPNFPGEIEFIRQRRLKRFSSSTANVREQRESDDSLLSHLQPHTRVDSALPSPPTAASCSHTSVTSDGSSTFMFEINHMIQVDRPDSAPWYGVIRWIGTLPGFNTRLAGIEMVK